MNATRQDLVMVCDGSGTVLRVIRNTLGLPDRRLAGRRLVALADGLASPDARQDRPQGGTCADLECRADTLFPGAGGLRVHVVGLASHGTWLVACAADPASVGRLRDELMRMHRASSKLLNLFNQPPAQPGGLPGDGLDEEIYEELTRVNHEIEKLQRALSRSQADLARCQADRAHLLSLAARELRGPLHEILACGRLLESDAAEPLRAAQAGHIARILEAGAAMVASLDGLPGAVPVDSAPLHLNKHTVHLAPLIKGAVVRAAALAGHKGMSVRADLAPDLPILHADGKRLRDVMDQLLAHAITLAPEQSCIRVEARSGEQPALVCITAQVLGQDSIGDEAHRPVPEHGCTSARAVPGQLGQAMRLATVRRLVEAHGGVLDVSSLQGGALFSLTLPTRHDD